MRAPEGVELAGSETATQPHRLVHRRQQAPAALPRDLAAGAVGRHTIGWGALVLLLANHFRQPGTSSTYGVCRGPPCQAQQYPTSCCGERPEYSQRRDTWQEGLGKRQVRQECLASAVPLPGASSGMLRGSAFRHGSRSDPSPQPPLNCPRRQSMQAHTARAFEMQGHGLRRVLWLPASVHQLSRGLRARLEARAPLRGRPPGFGGDPTEDSGALPDAERVGEPVRRAA